MEAHKRRLETEIDAEKRNQWAEKIELWKNALTQVANLKGKDAKGWKETEFIKEIVSNIHQMLGVISCNTRPRLIGMRYYIQLISSWLTNGSSHTADILTIVGMGGIGKTSLAKYVFQLHSSKFQKSSFIEGITTRCNQHFDGMLHLQKQLYGDISKKITISVNDVSVYTSKIEHALSGKMLFLVLDDIGSLDELDALLGNKGFHPGSKIIITTKDASITERCALFNPQLQPTHKKVPLNGLHEFDSLELLCIHAFKSQRPKKGYTEVSEKLVKYCDGHPLALEVMGKSLHKRDVAYWEECIKGLNKEPHFRISKALKMSINDSLPFNDKELFKHIACFFVGIDRDVTETILNACDINTRSGITNLIERCLLSIGWENKLTMHRLAQEMGRDLVRQESLDKPWKCSRLWCHEESFKVLKQEKGKGNLLGLALDMRMLEKKNLHGSSELKTKSLSKMNNLMLLQLNYVQLNGCFGNFPKELRWLCMHGFPLKSIPLDLQMENLVALDMSFSNIEFCDMSKDKRLLGSLKILDLSFRKQLRNVGGFLELPALERLIVKNCPSLIEVCGSIEHSAELVYIDLSYCCKLKRVPISIDKLKKVKTLLLEGCASGDPKIDTCDMNSSAITEAIPSDLNFLAMSLPISLISLSLANNNLSNDSFPVDWSCLSLLEVLYLDGNPIVSMPNCVRTLPRLKGLSMENCEKLISIEHPPRTLTDLVVLVDYGNTSLRKIKFDPEMSPLYLFGARRISSDPFEIDGIIKIQALSGVENSVLQSLGWKNLDFIKETCLGASQTKMYYEFGIFSTFYMGKEMPDWIRCRSKGPTLSFTIPSSPNKLRGFNFCVQTLGQNSYSLKLPLIKISNITKNRTWIYRHYINGVSGFGKHLSLLSHWMFGANEMKDGDHITITVVAQKRNGKLDASGAYYESWNDDSWGHLIDRYGQQLTEECGIGFVYEDGSMEDVLGYYKSWNHIIGGDLSAFQLTTGEYVLHNIRFSLFYGTYVDYISSFN